MPPGAIGLIGGIVIGALVQRARLCSFGAIEDALMGGDWRRLKIFGLALAIALAMAQALVLAEILDPARVTYVQTQVPLLGLALGGLMFGIGMALVGTCGFGSLVRLGTGDLRALIVVIVLGAAAYATLRGVLSDIRIGIVEQAAIAMPGPSLADLPTQLARWLGFDPRAALAVLLVAGLLAVAARDRRLWRTPRLVAAGIALGIVTGLGWAATSWWTDPFALHQRPASLTFVAPIARAVFGVIAGQDSLVDFGVASVAGTVIGACAMSLRAREFRWEAFDDHREMRRHLTGGVLMGTGGVLAGGCTIGQGLSAGSMLALSMPIALFAMVIGARIGIAIIVGEARDLLGRFAARLSGG
jgi:uncharacterized membrane protein YedE/YeeE